MITEEELDILHQELYEFLQAVMNKLEERDEERRAQWLEGGVEDNLFLARMKAMRLWRNFQDHGDSHRVTFYDDAIDMINYTLFSVYCYKHGLMQREEEDASTDQTSHRPATIPGR